MRIFLHFVFSSLISFKQSKTEIGKVVNLQTFELLRNFTVATRAEMAGLN